MYVTVTRFFFFFFFCFCFLLFFLFSYWYNFSVVSKFRILIASLHQFEYEHCYFSFANRCK